MTWTIQIQDRTKVIQMSDPGPNALDTEFLKHLEREFESDDNFDGMILTGNGFFFSAGLNILTLINANRKGIREVITLFNQLLKKVMTFPGPVIAMVNGHAIAGGCLLALSCDHRIGTPGNYKIGINELALGVDLPPSAIVAIRKTIPIHHQFDVSILGKFYTPEEATKVGLLNEIVDSEKALPRALERINTLQNSIRPFQRLKKRLLKNEMEDLKNDVSFADEFVEQWFSPEAQSRLQAAVEKLRKN